MPLESIAHRLVIPIEVILVPGDIHKVRVSAKGSFLNVRTFRDSESFGMKRVLAHVHSSKSRLSAHCISC